MTWTIKAEYDSPQRAWEEKASLETQAPELAGFIVINGNSITIRNSTPEKAQETEAWVRMYTSPLAITIREERGLQGALKRISQAGQRMQNITTGSPPQRGGLKGPIPSVAELLGAETSKIANRPRRSRYA